MPNSFEPFYLKTDKYDNAVCSLQEWVEVVELHGGDMERLKQLKSKERNGGAGHFHFGEGAEFISAPTLGERYEKKCPVMFKTETFCVRRC